MKTRKFLWKIFAACFMLFAILNKLAAQSPITSWKELGPKGPQNMGVGIIRSFAVHPSNQDIIYIVSSGGGFWKTTNGASTWTTTTDFLPTLNFFSVAMDPSNVNTLYIGSSGEGIFKSTDAGSNWTNSGFTDKSFNTVWKILVHPTNPSVIFAATDQGLYKTLNGGSSWQKMINDYIIDAEFKPGDPNTVYASGLYFYKSSDGGTNFIPNDFISSTSNNTMIGVTAANPNYIYVLRNNSDSFGALYRSTDAGLSFTIQSSGDPSKCTNWFEPNNYCAPGGQGYYNMGITVSPVNANEVVIAANICNLSSDGGKTFSHLGYHHWDVHDVQYYNGTTLYNGNDGGIFKSTDKGQNWTDLSNGLAIRQFYRMGSFPGDSRFISGGAQDNGSVQYNGSSWFGVSGGDGGESVWDHSDSNKVYTSDQSSMYLSIGKQLNPPSLPQPSEPRPFVMNMVADPVNAGTMYAGFMNVYKYTNDGQTYSKLSNFNDGLTIDRMAISISNPDYFYISKGGVLYLSSNGGVTFQQIYSLNGFISYIAVHPENPNKVALALGDDPSKIVYSSNAGQSWTPLALNLPNITAWCVIFDKGSNDAMYVGMNKGVYYKDNTTAQWTLNNIQLPNVQVNELDIHYKDRKIRAATFGRGIWEAGLNAVSSSCPSGYVANYSNSTNICAGASTSFWSTSQGNFTNYQWNVNGVLAGTGPNLTYKFNNAGNYTITLIASTSTCSTSVSKIFSVLGAGPITGPTAVSPGSTAVYSVPSISGTQYNWWVNGSGNISSGQGTNQVTVQFSPYYIGGGVSVGETLANGCYTQADLSVSKSSGFRLAASGSVSSSNAYPNPFTSELSVTVPEGEAFTLTVTNTNGDLVYKKELPASSSEQTIMLGADLNDGLYMVKLLGENELRTWKIVKIK
jgi:photosystem II stability/assembly factor-like uncharacterized protein